MERRTILKGICGVIVTACTVVVGLPAVQFLIAPLRKKKDAGGLVQRVARLDQLKPDVPALFGLVGDRQDAWTHYSNEVVGRVWLVRRSNGDTSPEATVVEAFTSECPHLGCSIQVKDDHQFICPCHKAVFDEDGKRLGKEALGYENPSPRDMDALKCRVVTQDGQPWVEVEFQRFKMGLATSQPMS